MAVAGVTTNDTDVALFTVKVAVPDRAPKVAVMTDVPGATPVATPPPAPFGDMVATATVPEVQLEAVVLLMVVPSLNVSVAVNCWVPVTGIEAVAGVTTNDTDAGVTVKVAEADRPPRVAVMTDVPGTTPVARPDVLLTVATLGVPEVQLEDAVTTLDDPSINVAVAVYCWVLVIGIEAVAGVTARETRPGKPKPKIGSRPASPPPPQPAAKALSSKAMTHGRNLE